MIKKIPIRIKIVRTVNGHEFQARYHWYCLDKRIGHIYIKPTSLRLNENNERLNLTDKQGFYQLIPFTFDVDLS